MRGGHFGWWYGILAMALQAINLSGALGQQVHRNDLGGAQVYLLRGTANARYQETAHSVSTEYAHAGSSSEFLSLENEACTQAGPYIWYVYPTPRAPVSEDLQASVCVKANNPGIRLCARLVLPRMRSPEPGHEDQALTTIVEGEAYNNTDSWQRLELSHVPRLLRENQQLLRARLGQDIDLTDAYVDQL